MKKLILILSLTLATVAQAQHPRFISPEEYQPASNWNLFIDKAYTKENYQASEAQLESLKTIMKTFQGFEKYPIGLCETRSHYISLMADKAGISTFKVWLMAESLISSLGGNRSINLKSTPFEKGWQYHVATAVFSQKTAEILIFDPAINSGDPLPLNKWLESFDAPNSVYFYAGPGYFQYYADKCNKFNGTFWKLYTKGNNEALITNDKNVSDWLSYFSIRLAANNLASTYFTKDKTADFYKLLVAYDDFKTWVVNESDSRFPNQRKELNDFKKQYIEKLKDLKPNTYMIVPSKETN